MKQVIALFLFISGFVGCASTDLTSFKDPAFFNVRYRKILVIAPSSDLGIRQSREKRMVGTFLDRGILAMPSLELFVPTRTYTDEEKIRELIVNKIDAYLEIVVKDQGYTDFYMPPTGAKTETKGNATSSGNQITYQSKSTTTYTGESSYSKPWADGDLKLVDVVTGKVAWIASSSSGGNAYATMGTVLNSMCRETVSKLIEDGLVTEGPKVIIIDSIDVRQTN